MQQSTQNPHDLTRSTLAVLFVVTLIVSAAWVMLPFLSALLWATMIVIATWPLMLALQSRLGGRRGLATAIMTVAMLLGLLIPLSLAVGALVGNVDGIIAQVNSLQEFSVPPPPAWVAQIPIKGRELHAQWQQLSAEGPGSLSAWLAPHTGAVLLWFSARIGGLGGVVLQFLFTVVLSAVLYVNGETAAGGVRRFANRLAGASGDRAAVLAAGTIRGVATGVIVTAVAQTVVAAAGLLVASVPAAWLLVAGILVLNLAQVGPWLVMIPVIVWKFYSGDSFFGFVLLAFALVAGTMDNFIRPFLIRKGADLPLLLILAGVIGGLIGFGIMGIFVGPVILAVTYTLVREWVNTPFTPAALDVTEDPAGPKAQAAA